MKDTLAQQIADFITARPDIATDEAFERLALALFTRQYECVAPYRRLCDSNGAAPGTVKRWQDIPAVPASAFKAFDLLLRPSGRNRCRVSFVGNHRRGNQPPPF